MWGHYHAVPTTTRPVTKAIAQASVADLQLFPWGSLVTVSCAAQASFCLTQTTTVVIQSGANDGFVVDNGYVNAPDGIGSCFRVEAGTWRDITVFRRIFDQSTSITARSGVCSGNANTVRYPCRVDGDCGSGGTCTTAAIDGKPAREYIAGAYLVSRAASATNCFISAEY